MFSHESIPLVAIFIIMLIGVLVAFLHPVHAFFSWLRRRSEKLRLVLRKKRIRAELFLKARLRPGIFRNAMQLADISRWAIERFG